MGRGLVEGKKGKRGWMNEEERMERGVKNMKWWKKMKKSSTIKRSKEW